MKPIAEFKIYPALKGIFFEVFVWNDHDELSEAVKKSGYTVSKNCKALCQTFTQGNPTRLGELHFIKGAAGVSTIAHELMHATLSWGRAKRMRIGKIETYKTGQLKHDSPEEKLCYAMGRMTAQVTNGFFKYGVWK